MTCLPLICLVSLLRAAPQGISTAVTSTGLPDIKHPGGASCRLPAATGECSRSSLPQSSSTSLVLGAEIGLATGECSRSGLPQSSSLSLVLGAEIGLATGECSRSGLPQSSSLSLVLGAEIGLATKASLDRGLSSRVPRPRPKGKSGNVSGLICQRVVVSNVKGHRQGAGLPQ